MIKSSRSTFNILRKQISCHLSRDRLDRLYSSKLKSGVSPLNRKPLVKTCSPLTINAHKISTQRRTLCTSLDFFDEKDETNILEMASRLTKLLGRVKSVQVARMEASILIGISINKDREYVIMNPRQKLSLEERKKIRANLEKRLAEMPMAYIRGSQEFWSMDFEVSDCTLIPRPPTETLVSETLEMIKLKGWKSGTVLELGTGTGCVIISLMKELIGLQNKTGNSTDESMGRWKAVAVDIQQGAIEVARKNCERLLPQHCNQLDFVQSDWTSSLPRDAIFDVVVSNPPYLTEWDWENLPQTIQNFEPSVAFRAGEDGLDCYRTISKQVPRFMKRGGILSLETGAWQQEEITKVFNNEGFQLLGAFKDTESYPRVLIFEYSSDQTVL